jgi:hypothetical protein
LTLPSGVSIEVGGKIRKRICLGTLTSESFGNELQGALFKGNREINRSEQEHLG